MVSYVFCLIPEKEVSSRLTDLKDRIKNITGEQLYLSDPPHLTLYLGNFNNIFDKDWDIFLKKTFSKKLSSFEILPIKIFEKDPVTGGQAPIYPISENNDLFKLQMTLADFLKNKKLSRNLHRYESSKIQGIFRENIEEYGYPFVGKIWIPHFGIASFDEELLNKAMKEISKTTIKGTHKFSYFVVYELNEDNEKLKEAKRYKLQC